MKSSSTIAFALGAILVSSAFGAQSAWAASKKDRLESSSVPSISIMADEGTPIIMQGLKRPKRAVQDRRDTSKRTRATKEAERHIKIPRGSGGLVPSTYSAGGLPRTPLIGQGPATSAYNPPPVSNPSERISQFNQSFQFNKGLGNNPTDRDAYVRQNFNR